MDVDNLPPSLLTPTQREYFRRDVGGSIDPKSADERAIRRRTRERLKAGLYDLALLSRQLETRDWKTVLEDLDSGSDPTYLTLVEDILRFLFVGLLDPETETQGFDSPQELFNHVIGTAIEDSFPERGLHVDGVDVEITVKGISETLEPGESSTREFTGEIEALAAESDDLIFTVDGEEIDPSQYPDLAELSDPDGTEESTESESDRS